MKKVITRFAPSPTGFLTVAGIRTALYNYLYAKKHGGEFHLRFEDTDKAREVVGARDYIIDTFKWLGLDIDGEIVTQSNNLDVYKRYALELISNGKAYFAFDTKEELDKLRGDNPNKPISYSAYTRERMRNSLTLSEDEVSAYISSGRHFVIRFKTEKNKEIKFNDLIRGSVTFNTNNMDDKVLFKSDGYPTYHLASILDDCLLGTTHVVRGNEWLSSTPLHILLYEALGFPVPTFAHLPLVLDDKGKKISKRNAHKYTYPILPLSGSYVAMPENVEVTAVGFKEAGYLPEALLNALCLVGWTPKNTTSDVFSLNDIVNDFELSDIHNADAKFDINKLNFINKEYLKNKDLSYFYSFIDKGSLFNYDDDKLRLIANIALERSHVGKEFNSAVDYFFNPVKYDNVKVKRKDSFLSFAHKFLISIQDIDFNNINVIDDSIAFCCASLNMEKGKILPDLRNALTGGKSGAHLNETMCILGIDETTKRISDYCSFLFNVKDEVTA
jgi:glutamyl/glutaminyl-tRNA synthetase